MKIDWRLDPRTGMYYGYIVPEPFERSTDPAENMKAAVAYMKALYGSPQPVPAWRVWPGGSYVAPVHDDALPHPLVEAARFVGLFVRRHWRAIISRGRR